MQRGKFTRIIPITLVVIITIIAVAAIVSLGRAIFNGGDSRPKEEIVREALLITSPDRSVAMTVRGPIVADENFRSYRIAISPDQRTLTTYEGYLETVVDSKSLGNNTRAYDEFVHALDRADAMKGVEFEGDKDDTRGICATGNVVEFNIMQNNETVKRLWTSTCSGSKGSLDASLTQLRALFTEQIPDSKVLLRTVNL